MLPSPTAVANGAFLAHWQRLQAVGCTTLFDLKRVLIRLENALETDSLPPDALTCLSESQVRDAVRFDMCRRAEASIRRERVADRICLDLPLDRLLLELPEQIRDHWVRGLPLRFVGRRRGLRLARIEQSICPLHANGGPLTLGELAADFAAGLPIGDVTISYVESGRQRTYLDESASGAMSVEELFGALAVDLPLGTRVTDDLGRLRLLGPDGHAALPWSGEAHWL